MPKKNKRVRVVCLALVSVIAFWFSPYGAGMRTMAVPVEMTQTAGETEIVFASDGAYYRLTTDDPQTVYYFSDKSRFSYPASLHRRFGHAYLSFEDISTHADYMK